MPTIRAPSAPTASRSAGDGSSSTNPSTSQSPPAALIARTVQYTSRPKPPQPTMTRDGRGSGSCGTGSPMNSDIVTSPAPLTPSRRNTAPTVRSRILMSSDIQHWSTYSTSSANFRSQLRALRPETWARPVNPGSTSCRRACCGVYRSRYCMSSGRGPTSDICPRTMFQSVGSSSRLVLRNTRPRPVIRDASSRGPRTGSAGSIVRNFTRTNGAPCRPGRTWRKSTGRPSLTATAPAVAAWKGSDSKSATTANTRSSNRLV